MYNAFRLFMGVGKTIFLTLILAGSTMSAYSQTPREPQRMTWTVDGTLREAIVYAPVNAGRGKAPVVFAFHGGGDNAQHFTLTGLHESWREAVVVYMQALERTPGRGDTGYQNAAAGSSNRDLTFFDTALSDMRKKFRVDDRNIYAVGFSNGGRFVYLLWAARSKMFAGFAVVAGSLAPSLELKNPRPLIVIGSPEDRSVNYKSQMDSVEVARKVNFATEPGQPCGANCTSYRSALGAPVITVSHPDGHQYPAFASDTIVGFFRSRP